MAVAITTQLYGGGNPPYVLITITGLTGKVLFNVTKQGPSESAMPVRGGVGAVPVGDTAIIVDVAPPLNRPVIYTVETFTDTSLAGAQVSASPITVPLTGIRKHVLSDPVTGETVLVDLIATEDERTGKARAAALEPVGSAYPVVLFDVRQADSGTLAVYTRDRAETLTLQSLLDNGRPIVSRHTFDGCDVPSVEYVYPLDVTRARRTRTGDRIWALPFLNIALPDPSLLTLLVTLQDIYNYYQPSGTLATLQGDYSTLLQIAQSDFGAV